MKLFKRTPPPPALADLPPPRKLLPPPPPRKQQGERRRYPRFAISPEFPLKTVLSCIGRDEAGVPMSGSRTGWHWKGRLIDCSEDGARILLGPGLRTVTGEPCDLRLSIRDFSLVVPCHVTRIREVAEGAVFGLRHDIADEATLHDYRELVEVVALGSTLRQRARARPDASGYIVERYASSRPSALTVWRHPVDGAVSAFEFILRDSMVRAAARRHLEYFASSGTGVRAANAERCVEIHRLFQWVVPNLPDSMPADVRNFLGYYAA